MLIRDHWDFPCYVACFVSCGLHKTVKPCLKASGVTHLKASVTCLKASGITQSEQAAAVYSLAGNKHNVDGDGDLDTD